MPRAPWPLFTPALACFAWVACSVGSAPPPAVQIAIFPAATPAPYPIGPEDEGDEDPSADDEAGPNVLVTEPGPDGPAVEYLMEAGAGPVIVMPRDAQGAGMARLRARVSRAAFQAPRSTSSVLFQLNPGNVVTAIAHHGSWLLISVEGGGAALSVPDDTRGWIELDPHDRSWADRLPFDAGAP
jgi:hypothetical protein